MAEKRVDKIPRAEDLMEEIRLTFSPEMDLLQAIEVLARHGMSAAPVVDSERHLRGLLTEKDCLRILYDSALNRGRGGRVADYLSPVSEAIEIDMDIFRISEVFLGNNFPMLPVVDKGKLVGCITRQHMLEGIMTLTRAEDCEQLKIETDAREALKRPSAIGEMQKVYARYSKKQLLSRVRRKS